jgi:UDPglucose--hexose-1-phosphate uridylyltransferase
LKFYIHHHEKLDGRSLWLYSEEERTYNITNDLEPLEKETKPFKKIHPLRDEPVYFNSSRNIRTLAPPPEYNPLAAVQINGHPGEIPVEDFEVAIFQNRWPGLSDGSSEFMRDTSAYGRCEVVVYTPNPSGSLADLSISNISLLLNALSDRFEKIMDDTNISYVLPFENRGDFVGTSLPHPHGQIYAFGDLPPIIERQMKNAMENKVFSSLMNNIKTELIVAETEHTITFCPEFSRYPYETWILPKVHHTKPSEMTDKELKEISNAIKVQVKFFDEIYNKFMPYVLWHAFPAKNYAQYWPYHIQFWPLQRGEEKMKYLASVEQITGLFLVDVMPEYAAKQIRDFHQKNEI